MGRQARLALVGCIAAVGGFAGPGVASASQLTNMLQTYCAATHARVADAVKAAEADAFTTTDGAAELEQEISVHDGQVRVKEADGKRIALVVGQSTARGYLGDAPTDTCILLADTVEPGVDRDLSAWLGLKPVVQPPDGVLFMFADGPQGRRDVTRMTEEEARSEARAGRVTAVFYQTHSDQVVLTYAITRPVDAAAAEPSPAATPA